MIGENAIALDLSATPVAQQISPPYQDVEDRGLRPAVPAARNGDLAVHSGLRELSLIRGSRRS